MSKTKKGRTVGRIFLAIGLILSVTAGSMAATLVNKSNSMLGMMNYDDEGTISKMDLSKYELDANTDVINVLLVGADKNNDEQNADVDRRSDSIMIATIDVKNSELKITSIMRDLYVDIPGYGKNKINAAYSFGGIELLYKTLLENFGVKVDGYAEVNFDAFVNVIDKIGGVEVTLTESEAKGLQTTNYIKRRKYRKVKEGTQIFNGYQALGYCRIRHGKRVNGRYPGVYTASGLGDDYGRTERQRLTMQAILKKVKSMSIEELMEVAQVVMPSITTDLSKKKIYSYMLAVARMGTTEMKQNVIPVEGTFSGQRINGQDVLVPDLEANKTALKKFLYKS